MNKLILTGQYSFNAHVWSNVSYAAKDLIARMLVVDPEKRITIKEVLEHPWLACVSIKICLNFNIFLYLNPLPFENVS